MRKYNILTSASTLCDSYIFASNCYINRAALA